VTVPKRLNIRSLLALVGLTLVVFLVVTTTFLALNPQAQIDPNRLHGLPFVQTLSDNGLDTGNKVITGDYSTITKTFFLQPSPGFIFNVHAFRVTMQCNSNTGLSEEYCDQPPLTNGIRIRLSDNSGITGFLDATQVIKTNMDWSRICDVIIRDEPGNAKQVINIFCKNGESALTSLKLSGARGEKIEFIFSDDFSGLAFQSIVALGDIE